MEQEQPDALTKRPGYDDPWQTLRRRLEGLRLPTPGDHVEIARLHRMIAAHVRERMGDNAATTLGKLITHLHDGAGYQLQETWAHDPAALWVLVPLQEAVRLLLGRTSNPMLGRVASLVGEVEANIGRLDRADYFLRRALEVAEADLAANPESAQAARDVSVSLNTLADFLARRGLPGDAEKALGHYQRSLEVSERLLGANPESAQAARDVMVSLERMAAFEGGRPGGEAKALEFQTRALGIALKLRESNPQSVFYGRTAAVSFFLTYQRAQAVGQAQLANQCLGGCHAVLHELITAGCQLDPQMMNLYQQLHAHFGGGN